MVKINMKQIDIDDPKHILKVDDMFRYEEGLNAGRLC